MRLQELTIISENFMSQGDLLAFPEVEGLGGWQVGMQCVLASWRKGGVHH